MNTQNEPTILTPAEALRALADGKRLTRKTWNRSHYIHLTDLGTIRDDIGNPYALATCKELVLYTPPKIKKTVEVVRWVNVYENGTGHTFETEDEAMKHSRKNDFLIARVRCVGSYEIEVEEGEV